MVFRRIANKKSRPANMLCERTTKKPCYHLISFFPHEKNLNGYKKIPSRNNGRIPSQPNVKKKTVGARLQGHFRRQLCTSFQQTEALCSEGCRLLSFSQPFPISAFYYIFRASVNGKKTFKTLGFHPNTPLGISSPNPNRHKTMFCAEP